MVGLSVEETLELWASSLRAAKARMRPLFTQHGLRHRPNGFSTVCWARNGARRAGCERRRLEIRVFGGSRPFCDAPLGMPMPCAILFGTTPWTLFLIPRRFW